MDDDPLKSLGELAKPASTLIEKISDAVGGIFKPYQIVRVAKAEAQAEHIRVDAQIEISDLQRRAFRRFLEEEAIKQQNIETITRKALPELAPDSDPKRVDDDWITHFFDRGRLVSDEQMQSLWSRVLAGEANCPGTYSKRTVNFLSTLDVGDAELFTSLCGFAWFVGALTPLIYDQKEKIYNGKNINFSTLSHLETIGLIRFETLTGFQRTALPRHLDTAYYGAVVPLDLPNDSDNSVNLGKVLFTHIGHELAPISGSEPVDGFLDFVRDKWRSFNYLKEDTAPRPEPTDPPPSV
jgi:hypothetical protein